MTEPAEDLRAHLDSLPFITPHIEPVPAEIKREPEDFVVEELPAYLPSGAGEHLYLWIEKRERNTPEAVRMLCERAGADFQDAGWAGLKDKQAVTRQWVSLKCAETPSAEALSGEGVTVLEVSRHNNKLRTGHLRANRFTLRLTGVAPEHDARVSAVLEHLQQHGLPHYFGSQRFGHGGRNVTAAHAWLVGGKRAPDKPFLRKLFVSALQAALFNAVLGERITRGLFGAALDGDVMRKEDSGGMFVSSDPALDGERVARWEISPTGPMFGTHMKAPERAALELEQNVLARFAIDTACFARAKKLAEGTRRPLRVRPTEVRLVRQDAHLTLSFELPKGAYATSLVAEITKSRGHILGEEAT